MSLTRRSFITHSLSAAITAPLLAAAASRATEGAEPAKELVTPKEVISNGGTGKLVHLRYLVNLTVGFPQYPTNQPTLQLISRHDDGPMARDYFTFSSMQMVNIKSPSGRTAYLCKDVTWIGAEQSAGNGLICYTYRDIPVIGDLFVELDRSLPEYREDIIGIGVVGANDSQVGVAYWDTAAGETQLPWTTTRRSNYP